MMMRTAKSGLWAAALMLWTVSLSAQQGEPSAAAADLTGAWTISFSSDYGSVTLDADLHQDGTTLHGQTGDAMGYRTEFAEGTIQGDTLSFQVDVEVEGQWFPLYFDGSVAGGEITGRVEIPDGTRERFTAKRKESD